MTGRHAYPSLKQLLALFGRSEVSLLTAPSDPDVQVTTHTVLDLAEKAGPEYKGALLMAVGICPEDTALLDALPALGEAGIAAIALKTRGSRTGPLIEAATAAGIAVVDVSDEFPWRHVDALLAAATGDVRNGAPGFSSADAVGDLFALANAVAAMVGGAITIEDPQQRILAYSNLPGQPIDDVRREVILGRQVPDRYLQAYRHLYRAQGVVRFGCAPLPRIAVAVRAGADLLGSIWAVGSSGETFGPEAERALAEAAASAALHLLRVRRATDLERRARSELLRSLLAGEPVSPTARLGIERGSMTVLAFELPSLPGTSVDVDIVGLQVADLVAACAETTARASSCVFEGGIVYALLPLPDESPEASGATTLAKTVLTRAEESLRIRLRVGIGSAVAPFADVPRSRQEADRVLTVLAAGRHSSRLACIEEVRSQAILLELEDTVVHDPLFQFTSVAAILRHDTEKQTQYAKTLLAYLEGFGDIAAAAETLHVHANTFRYRIRRIGDLFGVDLTNADERLLLWLQLRHLY
ncbi:PucR family transcriptional regulator [Streptomyces sp. NPDC002730]|uniref:PucR family transcriptional regulator n=1 Tax=Streptomyces sp. NPDC002730 TaxID=3364662 RepID=UPI003689ACAD